MSDLDIIRELEQELGVELPLFTDEDKSEWIYYIKSYYILDDNERVVALGLFNLEITKIPDIILNLKSLQKLELSFNHFSTLPESITNLRNLQELYLRGNRFSTLPESITNLKSLQTLDLSFNHFSTLPEFITNLKGLQTLDLRYNKLSTLPESITNLKGLQTLDLRGNQLPTLPESIDNLISLQDLDLSDNKLLTLPEPITNLKSLQTLNLWDNQISTLPDSITNLKSLQTLNLWGNQISTLPDSITNLKSLQTLNLRGNRFSNLPESITNLKSLQTLDLRYNKLSTLPESITNLKGLQDLDLSGNELSTLPEFITNLKGLQTLDLRYNKLSTLPESIDNLISLQGLDLSDNKLSTLPESFTKLKNLQKLNLSNNLFSSGHGSYSKHNFMDFSPLPESIGNLISLQELHLNRNQLLTLPDSFKKLINLQKLDLSENQYSKRSTSYISMDLDLNYNEFSALPESLANLKGLKDLNLSRNRLSTLPKSFTKLINLQKLDLSYSELSTLPESVTSLKGLQELDLSYNELSTLPESFTKLKNLQKLDLSSNKLSTLPESFTKLKNLQKLDLSSNKLSTLPESVTSLKGLRELDLSATWLSTLPESFTSLKSLQKLALRVTCLSTLPESVTSLKSLKELDLSDNRLSTLPESISNLKSLKELDLSNNQLSALPESICSLKSLWKLDLSDNQLSALPESIANLISLKELYLHYNQIRKSKQIKQLFFISTLERLSLFCNSIEDIPEEFLGLDVFDNLLTELKDYFLARERGIEKDYEYKVIVIGNGGVGKSSLIRRMVENKFDENEESTHAIRLLRWSLSYNPASNCYLVNDEPPEGFIPLRLNIWDFGGQDLYHATHQLFMRTKALFLLVWDMKHEVEYKTTDAHDYTSINHPVQYWLDYCHTLGEDSPVIIGQNMFDSDEVSNFAGYDKLNRAYNIISKDFHLNVKEMVNSDYSFKKFITTMTKTACEMTKEHSELPKAWITLREDIYKIREDEPDKKSLTMNEYLDLCDETGVTAIESETVANTVLDYFHNTGVLFYKKDIFEGQIIIDQQWAIEAVYTLFDRDKSYYRALKRSGGAFILSDLEIIDGDWKERSLDEQKLLISYMESCELIFAYRKIVDYNDKEEWEYIIPQLLPDRKESSKEINKIWRKNDSKRAIFFRYQYEMLHCAVIYRLIARLGRLSPNNATMWNRGLIIHDEKSDGLILIEAKPEHNSVEIAISAKDNNSRRELIGQIESEFEALHNHQKSKREVSPNGVDFVELDTLKMKAREGANKLDSIEKKTCDVADFHIFIGLERLEKENSRRLSKSSKEHREKEKKMISREIKGFIIDKFAGSSSDFDDLCRELGVKNVFSGNFDEMITSLIKKIEQNIPNYSQKLYDGLIELKGQHKKKIDNLFSTYPIQYDDSDDSTDFNINERDKHYIKINNPTNCQIIGTVQNSELNYNKEEPSEHTSTILDG